MTRELVHAAALTAALLVVVAGIWRSWPLASTLALLLLAYFVSFLLGSLGAIALSAGPAARDAEGPGSDRPRREA